MYSSLPSDVSILINNEMLSPEFHVCEVGYEQCRSTKPMEYAPIDYWVIHYCVAGEGFFPHRFFLKEKLQPETFLSFHRIVKMCIILIARTRGSIAGSDFQER